MSWLLIIDRNKNVRARQDRRTICANSQIVAIVVTLMALTLVLSACAPRTSSATATAVLDSSTPISPPPREASPRAVPTESEYRMLTYTLMLDNGAGDQMKATFTIGPWLRGSDSAALENAWRQVSGENDMPLVSGTYVPKGGGGEGGLRLNSSQAAYIFGSLALESIPPKKDPADFYNPLDTDPPDSPIAYLQLRDQSAWKKINPTGTSVPYSVPSACSEGKPGGEVCPNPLPGKSRSFATDGLLVYCVAGSCWRYFSLPELDFPRDSFHGDGASSAVPFVIAVPRVFGHDALGWDIEHSEFQFEFPDAGYYGSGSVSPGSGDLSDMVPTEISW